MNIFIKHLRRSGGHAIINWILGHFNNVMFFNNVNKHGIAPQIEFFGNENIKKVENIIFSVENGYFSPPKLNKNKYKEFRINGVNKKIKPNTFHFEKNEKTDLQKIIIMRDPLNWAASYIKRTGNLKEMTLDDYKRFYKIYKEDKNFYGINYNKWFFSYDYRRNIEYDLNLGFSDIHLNEVTIYGSGSSFNNRDYNGKAQNMKILDRWKELKDDKNIKQILNDNELKSILKNEFNMDV